MHKQSVKLYQGCYLSTAIKSKASGTIKEKIFKEWFNMKNTRRPLIILAMALLLTVVMVMSCVTFAKYIISTNEHTNSAKVAKWGWTVSADASNLFGEKYAAGDGTLSVVANEGTLVVSGRPGTNVVAPGTTGSMTFSIGGKAEVLSRITVEASGQDVVLKQDESPVYYPVKWTLTKDGVAVSGCENVALATIIAHIDAFDETVDANTVSSNEGDYELTWAWAWEANNDNDTILGKIANAGGASVDGYTADLTTSVAITITIEQVQA